MNLRRVTAAVAVGLLIALAVSWRLGTQHWLADHTGSDYCPTGMTPEQLSVCKAYGFWSGFGSDLGEYVIIAGLASGIITAWRVHTCHRFWWCWRRPLHPLEGTPYKLCHIHHPDDVQTVGEAIESYCDAKAADTPQEANVG